VSLANGTIFGDDPSVPAGGRIALDVAGFAPGAAVELRIACLSSMSRTAQADGAGTLRMSFAVPSDLPAGHYLLSMVGIGTSKDADRSATGSATDTPTGDGSAGIDLIVTVPRVAFYKFTVPAGTHAPVAGGPLGTRVC
jgi:hypothetical protein